MTKNLSNAKQLGLGVQLYAADHDGRFPFHLSELIPDYIPAEAWPQLLFVAEKVKDTAGPPEYDWLYFGAFASEQERPRILIASPRAVNVKGKNRRVVIHGGISGVIAFEEEYQADLAKMIEESKARREAPTPKRLDNSATAVPGKIEDEAVTK
jgi:hypothetical protein